MKPSPLQRLLPVLVAAGLLTSLSWVAAQVGPTHLPNTSTPPGVLTTSTNIAPGVTNGAGVAPGVTSSPNVAPGILTNAPAGITAPPVRPQ